MQQAEEAAAEAEAEGNGIFLCIGHGGIVELQLLQRVAQVAVFAAVGRIDAGVDHGLHGLVAGQRLAAGVLHAGDGVADAGVRHGLDGGREIADLARAESIGRDHAVRVQVADLDDLVFRTRGHHADVHAGAQHAVLHAEIDDHAAVGVVLTVEDQSLHGGLTVALRGGNVPHDVLKHSVDVDAVFGGNFRRFHGGDADDVLDLVLDLQRTGGRQVDLVHHGDDLQPGVNGKVGIGQRLGLDALRGIHDEHGALAGGQRPGDLVVEVHMARRVDEV